jgi:GAF domain-containing protein
MSEGIALPFVARGTLLPEAQRLERLALAAPQVIAVLEGETDLVALQSTLAALLWQALPQASWAGFYRRIGPTTLAVGPYQGPMGCLRIDFARGVCGACARTGEPQLVPDVTAFPGHIACDDETKSELVLPVVIKGRLEAVLDLDSHQLSAFSLSEQRALTDLVRTVFSER